MRFISALDFSWVGDGDLPLGLRCRFAEGLEWRVEGCTGCWIVGVTDQFPVGGHCPLDIKTIVLPNISLMEIKIMLGPCGRKNSLFHTKQLQAWTVNFLSGNYICSEIILRSLSWFCAICSQGFACEAFPLFSFCPGDLIFSGQRFCFILSQRQSSKKSTQGHLRECLNKWILFLLLVRV